MDVSMDNGRLVFTPESPRDEQELARWHKAAEEGPGLRIEVECINPHRAAVFAPCKSTTSAR